MPGLNAALALLPSPARLRNAVADLLLAAAERLSRPSPEAGPAALAPLPQDGGPTQDAAKGLALSRLAWADRLWGEGCLLPGGMAEIQRLSGLLPLSPATTVLLLGRDAGGAAGSLIAQRGAWVAVHQRDPVLRERMAARLRPYGRRAAVLPWDPACPAFRAGYHHHALALEALDGADPAALSMALAAALKPGAQLVMLEVVQGEHPGPAALLERWMALEGRAVPPRRRLAEAALQRAGFQLHVAEDTAPRHAAAIIESWSRMIAGLREAGAPALRVGAAGLVAEAELWLLRHRLMTSGALGFLRWHATLRR